MGCCWLLPTVLALHLGLVTAPAGSSFSRHSTATRSLPGGTLEHTFEAPGASSSVGAIAACAAAAVASIHACSRKRSKPNAKGKSFARQDPLTAAVFFNGDAALQKPVSYADVDVGSECVDDENVESEVEVDFDNSGDDEVLDALPRRAASKKLWSTKQFPEGTTGSNNYDLANLIAAQQWTCPCPDRISCIGPDRLSVLDLYEHRKAFRTCAHTLGGYRDATRKALEERLDKSTNSFARAFKVGPLPDCCAASAGLASGISFSQWCNARVDAKAGRPLRSGRRKARASVESEERATINAYIRDMRSTMEGPKGGSAPTDRWRTDKLPMSKRWEEYRRSRLKKGLRVIGVARIPAHACTSPCSWAHSHDNPCSLPFSGSESLFTKVWNEHTEIVVYPAKGHPTCDRCAVPTHAPLSPLLLIALRRSP